eukprot:gene6799-biopygen6764
MWLSVSALNSSAASFASLCIAAKTATIESCVSAARLRAGLVPREYRATESRPSSGHGSKKSIEQQLTSDGNVRTRARSVDPTGEKQRTTCSCRRVRDRKWLYCASRGSALAGAAARPGCFMTFAIASHIADRSSASNSAGTSPVLSKQDTSSRYPSSAKFSSLSISVVGPAEEPPVTPAAALMMRRKSSRHVSLV